MAYFQSACHRYESRHMHEATQLWVMTAHVLGVTNNAMVNLGRHTAQIRHTPFLNIGYAFQRCNLRLNLHHLLQLTKGS